MEPLTEKNNIEQNKLKNLFLFHLSPSILVENSREIFREIVSDTFGNRFISYRQFLINREVGECFEQISFSILENSKRVVTNQSNDPIIIGFRAKKSNISHQDLRDCTNSVMHLIGSFNDYLSDSEFEILKSKNTWVGRKNETFGLSLHLDTNESNDLFMEVNDYNFTYGLLKKRFLV